jgi:hypothetical protein
MKAVMGVQSEMVQLMMLGEKRSKDDSGMDEQMLEGKDH